MQIERKSIPATTVVEAAAMLTIPEVPAYAEKIIPMLLAMRQSLALQPVGREVYTHWVDLDSQDNLTELQIPLQK